MENDNVKFKNEFKKRLYNWVLRLIKFIDKLHKDSVCMVMGNQLLRSGTSILANYIEASSSSSKRDFINFFTYALKSANESKVWLCLLRDIGKGEKNRIRMVVERTDRNSQYFSFKHFNSKGQEIENDFTF